MALPRGARGDRPRPREASGVVAGREGAEVRAAASRPPSSDPRYLATVDRLLRAQAWRERGAAELFEAAVPLVPPGRWRTIVEGHVGEERAHYARVAEVWSATFGRPPAELDAWVTARLAEQPLPRVESWLELVGDGHNRWAMVHADDLADAYVRAAESGLSGEVFNVTDRSRSSVRGMATAAARAAGFKGESRARRVRPLARDRAPLVRPSRRRRQRLRDRRGAQDARFGGGRARLPRRPRAHGRRRRPRPRRLTADRPPEARQAFRFSC